MAREWKVRRGGMGDLGGIVGVARGCAEAPQWSDGIWGEVLGGGADRVCLVAEDEGEVVGFVVVGRVCEVAALESVAVSVGSRRRGVGRALCEAGMAWARGVGAASMELEVRAGSEGARTLYGMLGFREQGKRRGYYREPVEDAVLMRVVL